jgi:hypothetical protein
VNPRSLCGRTLRWPQPQAHAVHDERKPISADAEVALHQNPGAIFKLVYPPPPALYTHIRVCSRALMVVHAAPHH